MNKINVILWRVYIPKRKDTRNFMAGINKLERNFKPLQNNENSSEFQRSKTIVKTERFLL
jgi:hypothetical protein